MPKNLKEAGSIGAIPILILLAALGTLGFLLISNTADFKDKLFSTLFPKPSSEAAGKNTSMPAASTSMATSKSPPVVIDDDDTPHPAGWHAPRDHEHGDAPPQWVLGSQWRPFTQSRERHEGYKGVHVRRDDGLESYLIAHILSRSGARSHGDHDYQLWIREPNGVVSHWGIPGSENTSVLDFGPQPQSQRCTKSGQRPSIEEFNNTEAWYMAGGGSRGIALNVAWLMYGPNQPFCPGIIAGDGSERDIGWSVNADVFPGPDAQSVSPTLKQYCVQEDKGCMIKFARGRFDYASTPMSLPN